MRRSPFMIQDYPELVKFFAARDPLQLLMFILPLWGAALYGIKTSAVAPLQALALIVLGISYWTFLEYAIHRWAYHTPYKNKLVSYVLGSFHLYHHKDMADRRVYNAGFLMIYTLAPAVLSPVLLLTRDPGILAPLVLGVSGGHFIYECVHYLLHYKAYDRGYLGYIQKYHFHHHDRAPHKNFGNTSHVWDWLLGSYDENYKSYEMSTSSRNSLITARITDAHSRRA